MCAERSHIHANNFGSGIVLAGNRVGYSSRQPGNCRILKSSMENMKYLQKFEILS